MSITKISFPEFGLKAYLLEYAASSEKCSSWILFSRSIDHLLSVSLGDGILLTGPACVILTGPVDAVVTYF